MSQPENLEPNVYRDELLKLLYGCPLFEPDPGDEAHVQIGDVGYINRSTGHFHRAFNAFFDRSSAINSVNGVPPDFEPIPEQLTGTYLRTDLPAGVHSSKKVSTLQMNIGVQGAIIPIGASIELSCESERGAALIIKEPAQRIESKKEKKLGKELLKHFETWHAFLNDVFGDMPLREMVFVTGCARTSDWATATFLDKVLSGSLSFKVCDLQAASTSAALWGKWESSTSVPVRCGPSAVQRTYHLEDEPMKNQCIFIRGWRVGKRVRPLPPRLIKAAAEPKDDDPRADKDKDHVTLLRVENTSSDESLVGLYDEEAEMEEDVYQSSSTYDEAFEKLLDTHGADDVVLLHDDDVIEFILIKSQNDTNVTSELISWKWDHLDSTDSESEANSVNDMNMLEHVMDDYYGDLEPGEGDVDVNRSQERDGDTFSIFSTATTLVSAWNADDAISINSSSSTATLVESTDEEDLIEGKYLIQSTKHTPGMIGRIIKMFKKRPKNGMKDKDRYLFGSLGMNGQLVQWPYAYVEGQPQGDDDDGSSIISCSTLATVDNTPGTGRLIDTTIYQFLGSKLERFAFQISMQTLSPDRIAQFILDKLPGFDASIFREVELGNIVSEICKLTDGPVLIVGLKSLVKQTQSGSMYRSSAALAALVRVSSASGSFGSFYTAVARIEPIFEVETLAESLDENHPEKKWLQLLAKIARANLYLWETFASNSQLSVRLKQGLLNILELTGTAHGIAPIGDACILLARAASWLWSGKMSRPTYFDIAETSSLFVIFLIKSGAELYRYAMATEKTQHVAPAVLSTLFRWIDTAAYFVLCRTHVPETSVVKQIEFVLSMYGIFLSAGPETHMLFCQSFSRVDKVSAISRDILPRTIRNRDADLNQAFHYIFHTKRSRALRLLISSKELEREIRDSTQNKVSFMSPPDVVTSDDKTWSIEKLENSLKQAQKVQASGPLVEEFIWARYAGMEKIQVWKEYKEHCQMRHTWGEYFRSSLDWDWDLSSCLKCLYRIERGKKVSKALDVFHKISTPAPTTDKIMDNGTSQRQSTEQSSPKTVRIAYKTEAGKTKYKTFVACESMEDVTEITR